MKQSRAQRKKAVQPLAPPPVPMVEICRSFSYTLQARQYEPRGFFCSFKGQCPPEQAVEFSQSADDFCQEQVLTDVKEYRAKLAQQQQRGEVSA